MGKFLFDLVSCQSSGAILNHGGKEYAEAVFMEIMRRGIKVTGIYNSHERINASFLDYCKKSGKLIDNNQVSLQQVIDTGEYDVFYSPLPYAYYDINWGKVIFLGNIHGLRAIEIYTDKYEFKLALTPADQVKAVLKRIPFVKSLFVKRYKKKVGKLLYNPSFKCLTGSFHSKYSIMNHFPGIDGNRVSVYYDPLIIENQIEVENTIGEKYYLLVSGNRWLKNNYRGIIALDNLMTTGQLNSKVVVTGCLDKLIAKISKDLKNRQNFIFKGYVSTEELSSLYKNAYCLLFLSLSEGFGYPPLEAISRGVPVICSPLTALYEVYQNGVLYCDPKSVDDIKTKILMMDNSLIRAEYIRKGIDRANELKLIQDRDLKQLVDYILSFCSEI